MRKLIQVLGIYNRGDEKKTRSVSNQDDYLRVALKTRNFQRITVALQEWCTDKSSNTEWLISTLAELNYSESEIEKTKIMICYYKSETVRALELADKYLEERGFDEDICVIKLVAHYLAGQMERAYAYLNSSETRIMISTERSDYWQMRASILWAMNNFEELGLAIDKAVELSQTNRDVHETALAIYIEMDDRDRINTTLEKVRKIEGPAGFAHALNLLALSKYREGFEMMEARYDNKDAHRYLNMALFATPRWRGEPLVGLRLLISAEQGLGDTVQMARYLKLISELKCKTVHVEVQPELMDLMRFNYPEIEITERVYGSMPDFDADYWVGMMSLPYLTNRYGTDTPFSDGYLSVPSDNAAYWQTRIAEITSNNEFKIGVAWSGQPSHRADRRRSIPFEVMMGNLIRKSDAIFFTLQTHVPDVCPENLFNMSDELITMTDTAALINQMDLVITVDTSVAHLAGALGKETWLLLPKCYEWRWGQEGEGNHWYSSVKVLRQKRHGHWVPLLTDISDRRLPEKMKSLESF